MCVCVCLRTCVRACMRMSHGVFSWCKRSVVYCTTPCTNTQKDNPDLHPHILSCVQCIHTHCRWMNHHNSFIFWTLYASLPEGKHLRIENSSLTDRWLVCVSRRRPRSLCLYSCSGLSLTSSGLEMFFTLCRKTLEVKQQIRTRPVKRVLYCEALSWSLRASMKEWEAVKEKPLDVCHHMTSQRGPQIVGLDPPNQ